MSTLKEKAQYIIDFYGEDTVASHFARQVIKQQDELSFTVCKVIQESTPFDPQYHLSSFIYSHIEKDVEDENHKAD